MTDIPILIVGGGPVGMTLALALAHQGVPSMLIERNQSTTRHPKMDLTNGRSMEIYRRLGVVSALRTVGVPAEHPFDIVWVTSPAGEVLHRFAYPSSIEAAKRTELTNDGVWTREPPMRISQIVLEPVLKEALELNPLVDMRFGHKFCSLEQEKDGVTSTLELRDGSTLKVRSKYVVGCDGGGSTVRGILGINVAGQHAVARSYMVHFKSDARNILAPFGIAWHLQTATGTLIAQNDFDMWTLHVGVMPGTDEAAIDPRKVLRDFFGRDFNFEVLVANAWSPHLLVADSFRQGRVLLAGDSAHQVIPTGGYGMNTGVGDAFDLGWKLAAVISGWGGSTLLDSYETERQPIAIRNRDMSFAHAMLRIKIGQLIGEYAAEGSLEADDAAGRARRAKLGAAIAELGNAENEGWGIEHGYRYDGSQIIIPEADAPALDPLRAPPGTWPGSRLPHIILSDGRALYDLLGTQFTLIVVGNIETAAMEGAADRVGMPIAILRLEDEPILDLLERPLLLVRPDNHVAWRGVQCPDNAMEIIATACGK